VFGPFLKTVVRVFPWSEALTFCYWTASIKKYIISLHP